MKAHIVRIRWWEMMVQCVKPSAGMMFSLVLGEKTLVTHSLVISIMLCVGRELSPSWMMENSAWDQIGSTLLRVIEESSISIVVLSENYADSSWCLDELVKILECKESNNQLVWPIFYKVNPSDVRHQKGSYGEAMTNHEKRFGKDSKKVLQWRSTLNVIANMTGEHLKSEQW